MLYTSDADGIVFSESLKDHVVSLGFHLRISSTDSKVGTNVQHNKQHHRKVLRSSFYLNGHTLGFHPQTQKLEPMYNIINSTTGKYCAVAFI